MTDRRKITRAFPDYGWAWPRGELHRLLSAVLLSDESAALDTALAWLASNDIDQATFREHRLLAALSERFGKRLAASPAQPRLAGLQRMLWSRSRVALREARSALAALDAAELPFMLIKGASRLALDPRAARSRVSHDIDLLVRPADMGRAFGILLDDGWQAVSGAGALRLKATAPAFRAMNFLKSAYGDIDLHQAAYHPAQHDGADDDALWRRSVAAELDGVPARAPGAADRIALAIAHGALDAHTHSDWLVDVDHAIRGGAVDWQALLAILGTRRLLVPAASALTYLAQEMSTPVPDAALEALMRDVDRQGLAARLALLECKPRVDFTRVTATLRGIAKQVRLWRARRATYASEQNLWRSRLAWRIQAPHSLTLRPDAELPVDSGMTELDIALLVELPQPSRRVEFELSTPTRHLALLRYHKLGSFTGKRELRFRGAITLESSEDRLFLSARPARLSRDPESVARFGALPFAVIRFTPRHRAAVWSISEDDRLGRAEL